ncbi:MAG TPA: hypothetical protein VL087_00670 [Nitrospirota bacterium]|nr:hypothetical protein [Nitrospirota bacterium]
MAKRIMMKQKRMIKQIKTMYAETSFFCFLFMSRLKQFRYRTNLTNQYRWQYKATIATGRCIPSAGVGGFL